MGHFAREDIPVTWALADAHTSCDRWFSSLLGPTWPNRMYLHSGQSGGLRTNDFPAVGGIRIVQKPVLPAPRKRPPGPRPLSASEKQRLAGQLAPIEDDALRASLERLGATVLGSRAPKT